MPMSKQFRARHKLIENLHDIHADIVRAYLKILRLIEEKKFAHAAGRVGYISAISTELAYHVEALVTQQFKKIFETKPDITHSLGEIDEKKNQVLEWIGELKKAVIELQKVLHATVRQTFDLEKIQERSLELEEKFLDKSLMEFLSLSRNIFLEYSIYEALELSHKNEVQELYKRLKLHPRIRKVSEKLFRDGSFRNAILDSFIEIEKMTRKKSKVKKLGTKLFGPVFNPDTPILRFNSLETMQDKDEQRGFMHIFQGASLGIRNPKAHDTFIQKDAYRTLKYLCLASLLAERIDESKK